MMIELRISSEPVENAQLTPEATPDEREIATALSTPKFKKP